MHDKDATPIEAIDFESLQQPAKPSKESTPLLNSKAILWLAFIFLLFCGLIVFAFLPKYVAEKRNQDNIAKPVQIEVAPKQEIAEIIEEPTQEPLVKLSPEEISALKLEAEELLLQLIEKQKLLENKAVEKWAEQEFNIALALGSSGDEYFRKQDYQQAIASYKEAVMALSAIEEQIAPTLAGNLQKGELALTQAEKNTAIIHFELSKSIEPENQQAINGLIRAETIEELYILLEQGGTLEASNRFVDAKGTYLKAVALDPLSNEAKSALDRVNNRLTQNEFNRLINQGYAALKIQQFGDAKTAFQAANKLSPNSNESKQGLASVQQAIHKEKLSALMTEAEHFEEAEDWDNAAVSYQQILTLSPNSLPAQEGLQRNRQRADILTRLDDHIKNKLRLSSEQVAKEASLLLSEITAIDKPGKEIQQAAISLESLLQLVKQPISITLQSDNLTDIVIFKVGKFGKFEQHQLELKIGKYTIVGSRPGFRDVRKTLIVTTDMPEKTISVRCDEPI